MNRVWHDLKHSASNLGLTLVMGVLGTVAWLVFPRIAEEVEPYKIIAATVAIVMLLLLPWRILRFIRLIRRLENLPESEQAVILDNELASKGGKMPVEKWIEHKASALKLQGFLTAVVMVTAGYIIFSGNQPSATAVTPIPAQLTLVVGDKAELVSRDVATNLTITLASIDPVPGSGYVCAIRLESPGAAPLELRGGTGNVFTYSVYRLSILTVDTNKVKLFLTAD